MNILQVSAYFPPHIGGVETHVMELSKHLAHLGNEVEVVTSTSSSSPFFNVKTLETYFTFMGNPVLKGVRTIIRRGEFDVVHLHTPPQIPVHQAVQACKNADIPVVLTYHCDGEVGHPLLNFSIPLYMHTIWQMTLARVDRIIATTQSYASTSPYIRDREVSIVPSGVDIDRFDSKTSSNRIRKRYGIEDKLIIGFVGRLVRHKGVHILLDAIHQLDADNIACLIVGEGYMRKELEGIAQRKGMKDVMFTGMVHDDDLPHYYAAFDVFVLPSLSREEAFGCSVVEAMASGKPVLVSQIPGPDEAATDGCGLLFQKGNAVDLNDKLIGLLDDEALRREMGMLARKRAEERFDWNIISRKVLNIYQEVVS